MPDRRCGGSHDVDPAELRADLLDSLVALGAAADHIRHALSAAGGAYSVLRSHLGAEGKVTELLGLIDPIPLRADLSEASMELERARHRSQRLVFKLLHVEGLTKAEIARGWGVSRQLVSRLINEPEPDAPATR
jgi:DNA-directed RNA polymerase specialized sigma24 family protein